MDGKPLDGDATYTVMLMGFDDFLEHPTFCGSPLPEDLKAKRERQKMSYTNLDLVADVLDITGQFLGPTDYVTILSDK